MDSFDLLRVLDQLAPSKVLVLGDLILDRYTYGDAERISRETPIPVLRATDQEARLGGAANVAHMACGLDATVTCAGIVGDDRSGQTLRGLLTQAGIRCHALLDDSSRPTTEKERFVGRAAARHPNQILRVDRECPDPLAEPLEARLIETLRRQISLHQVLLISDYGKGVCTPSVLKSAIDVARQADCLVLVDPRHGGPVERYRGATLFKPNRVEAEQAFGRKINTPGDAIDAAAHLIHQFDFQQVVITMDRDGMILVCRDGTAKIFPTNVRDVYDITGAGDMVLATLGVCLAGGATYETAVRLANYAAGLEVKRAEVTIVGRDEIRDELAQGRKPGGRKIVTRDEAVSVAEQHRRCGRRIVFTNGCFDLLHLGHVTSLQQAASHGDVLIAGINSDSGVRRLKGEGRPVICQQDRAALLAALACVDHVIIFDEDTPRQLLHAIRPDVLVKGGTYADNEVIGHEVVKAYGGSVCVTAVVEGISTTQILKSLPLRTPQRSLHAA